MQAQYRDIWEYWEEQTKGLDERLGIRSLLGTAEPAPPPVTLVVDNVSKQEPRPS
jgi:hypothetical protein